MRICIGGCTGSKRRKRRDESRRGRLKSLRPKNAGRDAGVAGLEAHSTNTGRRPTPRIVAARDGYFRVTGL
jgi:hypothetical protein